MPAQFSDFYNARANDIGRMTLGNMPLNHSQERWHVRRHRYLHKSPTHMNLKFFVGWANSFIVCPRGTRYEKLRGHTQRVREPLRGKSVPTLRAPVHGVQFGRKIGDCGLSRKRERGISWQGSIAINVPFSLFLPDFYGSFPPICAGV